MCNSIADQPILVNEWMIWLHKADITIRPRYLHELALTSSRILRFVFYLADLCLYLICALKCILYTVAK